MSDSSKSTLLNNIAREWLAFNQFLEAIPEADWTATKNPDGWTIKDHVAHLAIWENSLIAVLQKIPLHQGLGVPADVFFSKDFDAMNAIIYKAHKNDSLQEVRANFQSTHAELVGLIETLSDADLEMPYAHYQPDEPDSGDFPVINLVRADTFEHYQEHQPWIEALLPEK